MPAVPSTGLFGGFVPGRGDSYTAATPGMCDAQASLLDVLYRLGFQPAGDLGPSSWVTPAELLQFADDQVKKLAYESGVFIEWDTSIAVAGAAVYNEPANHISTNLAFLMPPGGPVQLLRVTSVRDLWALDGNWPTTTGTPVRCSLDAGGVGTVALYPAPIGNGTLGQVIGTFPAIAAGATAIALPEVLQDLFSYAMLAGAKGKESDNADPAIAAHYGQMVELYERVCDHLWGTVE